MSYRQYETPAHIEATKEDLAFWEGGIVPVKFAKIPSVLPGEDGEGRNVFWYCTPEHSFIRCRKQTPGLDENGHHINGNAFDDCTGRQWYFPYDAIVYVMTP